MCRLVGYVGQEPLLLARLLEAPENSLIKQSRAAHRGDFSVNADGVGVAWYDHSVDDTPGLYKSIQPAWSNLNLRHLVHKIKSQCFIGHVRAATVGDVNVQNCHPFAYRQMAMAHNGSIRQFDRVRRALLNQLNDEHFKMIHGNTDSEHFFALLTHYLPTKVHHAWTLEHMAEAFVSAVADVNRWQAELNDHNAISKLNVLFSNGHGLLATHYVTDQKQDTLSLFYTRGETIAQTLDLRLNKQESACVIVASEPLGGSDQDWQAVPINHMLLIQPDLTISVKPIQ